MKKDYLPFTPNEQTSKETGYVESFWTDVWRNRGFQAQALDEIRKRQEWRILRGVLAGIPPHARILDGGCGMGEWTVALAALGYDAVGVDLSAETIARLQRQFRGPRFLAGDIRSLPFPDASFDVYFSWGTFEHFERGLGPCLTEAYRVLKPGGSLVISVPFQNRFHLFRDLRPLHIWDEHYSQHAGYRSPMRFYQWRFTKPELQRELALHGFATVALHPIHKVTGIARAIQHALHVPSGSGAQKGLTRLLYPMLPEGWISHMILAEGKKQHADPVS